jgi:hypothetical protein
MDFKPTKTPADLTEALGLHAHEMSGVDDVLRPMWTAHEMWFLVTIWNQTMPEGAE